MGQHTRYAVSSELAGDLTGPEYGYTNKQQIALEEMKERALSLSRPRRRARYDVRLACGSRDSAEADSESVPKPPRPSIFVRGTVQAIADGLLFPQAAIMAYLREVERQLGPGGIGRCGSGRPKRFGRF